MDNDHHKPEYPLYDDFFEKSKQDLRNQEILRLLRQEPKIELRVGEEATSLTSKTLEEDLCGKPMKIVDIDLDEKMVYLRLPGTSSFGYVPTYMSELDETYDYGQYLKALGVAKLKYPERLQYKEKDEGADAFS